MTIRIYNSLTKTKTEFIPIKHNKVNIYVCGLTVYDFAHLGHARLYVCFDVIIRYLKYKGYKVTYVRNITDIDDKIITRAIENKVTIEELTKKYIDEFRQDFAILNMLPPDLEPKATEHIPHIISLIGKLIEKKHAYISKSGDVYFDVETYTEYGELSHRDLDGQSEGIRVDVASDKKGAKDFVLWKMSKDDEPFWDSPFGNGRPGWHIECSAMSMHYLGEYFDIHGGGYDLLFPHHENELTQSKACTGSDFVKYWLHIGFLQLNKEKMSKSTGNFFTIRELLKTYHPETIRTFLLSSQYRSQQNFSEQNIKATDASLFRLYKALFDLDDVSLPEKSTHIDKFNEAMDDDFNTASALSVLFELAHLIEKNKASDIALASNYGAVLKELASILGLLSFDGIEFLQFGFDDEQKQSIAKLISERKDARINKDWAKSDQIRDELLSKNVVLEDNSSGTFWHRKIILDN